MTERTDRELLKLAAKAAGIDHPGGEHSRYNDGRLWDCNGLRWWNPLEDDGDALRLAVKLKLTIFQSDLFVRVGDAIEPLASESLRREAARRAIVRAAAAMAEGGEQ